MMPTHTLFEHAAYQPPAFIVCLCHESLGAIAADTKLQQRLAEQSKFMQNHGCALYLELCLDRYPDLNIQKLTQLWKIIPANRCILSCRPPAEGGQKLQPQEVLLTCYKAGQENSAMLLDIPLQFLQDDHWQSFIEDLQQTPPKQRPLLQLSYHQQKPHQALSKTFTASLEAYELLFKQAATYKIDSFKCIAQVDNEHQAYHWFQKILILQNCYQNAYKTCAFLMGDVGRWSRLLPLFTSCFAPWLYSKLPEQAGSAQGQYDIDSLWLWYKQQRHQKPPLLYGLIGTPIAHSLSPWFHNHRFSQLQKAALYLPFEQKTSEDVAVFLKDTAALLGIRGLSVTMPYKQQAMQHCATLGVEAQKAQSVNTLCLLPHGLWHGRNTDSLAIQQLLEEEGQTHTSLLIFGAGGMAKAALAAALKMPFLKKIFISNHNQQGALLLKQTMAPNDQRLVVIDWQSLSSPLQQPIAIWLQATPLGMANHPFAEAQPPHPQSPQDDPQLIIETVYHPAQTPLLRWAQQRGIRSVSGLQVFNMQATLQLACFLGDL